MRPVRFAYSMRTRRPSVSEQLMKILLRNNTYRNLLPVLARNGFGPVKLGEGAFRRAYRIRDNNDQCRVVKRVEDTTESSYPWGPVRTPYVRRAPTVRIGVWEVQYLYPKCNEEFRDWLQNLNADLKPENVGIDLDGSLVAFDW